MKKFVYLSKGRNDDGRWAERRFLKKIINFFLLHTTLDAPDEWLMISCFSSKSIVGNEAEHWLWEHAWVFNWFGLCDKRPPSSPVYKFTGDIIDGGGDEKCCCVMVGDGWCTCIMCSLNAWLRERRTFWGGNEEKKESEKGEYLVIFVCHGVDELFGGVLQ